MPSADQASGSPTKSAPRTSPRSSADSEAGAHSPFLQSLHQRFRKASTSSSNTPEQASPQVDVKSRTDASREAKRYLLSVVKDDWQYPPPTVTVSREPVDYQRREDGLSDIENDSPHKRRSRSDPYRFENPDAVADFVAQRRAKRRRLFEEEMTWNLGLRTWQRQRDAWTGAVKHRPRQKTTKQVPATNTKAQLSSTLHQRNTSDSTTDDSINWPLSPHSPTPENSSSIDSVDFQQPYTNSLASAPQFNSTSHNKYTHQTSHAASDFKDQDSSTEGEPYLPIYPPLFPPTHILRSRIQPTTYPTIYSKVVVQSLTPNIPIPLTHMTGALVQGWKSEGNWPPDSTANPSGQAGTLVDPNSVGGRLRSKDKESAFSKWRRERTHKNLGLPTSPPAFSRGSTDRRKSSATDNANALSFDGLGISERPSRVRKSISIVKRAFGVNDNEDSSLGVNVTSAEKMHLGDVPDIGIDFEEQVQEQNEEEKAWAREEEAWERDRVLNQGLSRGDGDRRSEEKRRSRGLIFGYWFELLD